MSVSSLLIQLHALADSDQLVIHSWVPSPPLASLALLTHAVAWLLWTQKHQASVGIDIASSLMDTLLYSIQPNFHLFLPANAEVLSTLMLDTLPIDPDLKLH